MQVCFAKLKHVKGFCFILKYVLNPWAISAQIPLHLCLSPRQLASLSLCLLFSLSLSLSPLCVCVFLSLPPPHLSLSHTHTCTLTLTQLKKCNFPEVSRILSGYALKELLNAPCQGISRGHDKEGVEALEKRDHHSRENGKGSTTKQVAENFTSVIHHSKRLSLDNIIIHYNIYSVCGIITAQFHLSIFHGIV